MLLDDIRHAALPTPIPVSIRRHSSRVTLSSSSSSSAVRRRCVEGVVEEPAGLDVVVGEERSRSVRLPVVEQAPVAGAPDHQVPGRAALQQAGVQVLQAQLDDRPDPECEGGFSFDFFGFIN